MLKRWLPCLTVLALLTVALAAAHADVTLTYKMTKGQILRYQCTTTGNGTITATGRTGPVSMNSTFDYVMTCTGVDVKGNLTILHAIENLKAEAYWNGQQLPVELSIPKITTVIAPNGATLSTQVHRETAPTSGSSMGLGGSILQASQFDVGQFFGELHGPGFPKEPVKPEQRWKQSIQLKTESGQPMVVNYTTSFLDYAKLREVNCARLQTDYEMPLDLGLMGGQLFNLKGTQKGSQVAYFDYAGGTTIRFDGIADTEMIMETPQVFSAGGGRQVAVTMNLRSNTSVVLQPQEVE